MITDRHANNFNLMRMVAATMVLVCHSFAIVGRPEPLHEQFILTLGSIAVDIFFVTSGFLVCESLMQRGMRAFVAARVLRIYPALIVAVLLTTLVCSLFFTSLPLNEFWTHRTTWSYVIRTATLAHPTGLAWHLPETLMNVPTASPPLKGGAINGSLGSVYDEVRMYVYLALALVAVQWVHRQWFAGHSREGAFRSALTAAAVVFIAADVARSFGADWKINGLHLFAMFFAGAALRGRDLGKLIRPLPAALALAAVLLGATAGRHAFLPLYIVCLPYLVLAAAYLPGGALREYNRLGDYSYGMYIYAWPVQQWTASLWPGATPWQVTAVALPCTLVLAVLSWYLIEKRMLALKSHWQPRAAPPLMARQHG